MRILILFFVLIISKVVPADELLLPDQIVDTPSSDTNSFISSESAKSIAPVITAADAAALVEKKFSGQVMSVTLLDTDAEHPVYGVKMLKNGHMKTIYVDATTGLLSKLSE
jgi:uncharacterized membrane protein YkoI